MMGGIDRSV